ncbi:hypothetical protein ILUMI_06089 [Ignelater luminosus]|uniref:PiggyBac transposable element-derived protein domain-containing protein n=1 Tax=Ignelater luminosus TaxID=2038154 RepID=A0A8K0D633_IGNLU|nr:hypothetical protein ILUMI_06089 [Ignelater luminosus]
MSELRYTSPEVTPSRCIQPTPYDTRANRDTYKYLLTRAITQWTVVTDGLFGDFPEAAVPKVLKYDTPRKGRTVSPYYDIAPCLMFRTSKDLLQIEPHLNLGYEGTDTRRDNRIPSHNPLPDKKGMKKSVIGKANGVMLTRWNDNDIVTIGSTVYGVNLLSEVKRVSQANKKNIQISRPFSVEQYNFSMGSTDLMDENISSFEEKS